MDEQVAGIRCSDWGIILKWALHSERQPIHKASSDETDPRQMMTRSQAACEWYRRNRYMHHLTDAELAERLDYCGNIVAGLKDGKISISDPIEGMPSDWPFFGFAWQKFVDAWEEYMIRGNTQITKVDLPDGPRLMKVPVMNHPVGIRGVDWKSEAKTGLGQRIAKVAESLQRDNPQAFVFVKYGKRQHMEQLAQNGKVRIGTAKGFEKDSNLARQDWETKFEMNRADEGKRVVQCGDYWLWCCTLANEGPLWVARCVHDFVDADPAAVVIADGADFLREMRHVMRQENRNAHCLGTRGVYYRDPLLDDVQSIDIPFTKHFRYMYQREQRAVWIPRFPYHIKPICLNVRAGIQRHLVV